MNICSLDVEKIKGRPPYQGLPIRNDGLYTSDLRAGGVADDRRVLVMVVVAVLDH